MNDSIVSSTDTPTPSSLSPSMRELLTVVIQTSPIPSHPSTALLEALLKSFHKYADGLMEARVIILADGCASVEQDGDLENHKHGKVSSRSATNYQEHLKQLRSKIYETKEYPFHASKEGGTLELVELPYRHGSARGVRAAFFELERKCQVSSINTPFVMIGQHDNFFVREAPVRTIVQAWHRTAGLGVGANCVHFPSTSTLHYLDKIQKRYGLTMEAKSSTAPELKEMSLVPLVFWYGRTHISTAEYFRKVIFQTKCPNLSPKDHLEELLGPTQLADILERGTHAHAEYGTYVIQPNQKDQNGIVKEEKEVLYHLSGRRARATNEQEDNTSPALTRITTESQTSSTLKAVYGNSFTHARSCKAIVPGLTIVGNDSSDKPKNQQKKFKQKCFHCGQKGHSFKFCPENQGEHTIASETMHLA